MEDCTEYDMKCIELKFGKGTVSFTLPERNYLGSILPNETTHGLTGEAEVIRALENPIGTGRLSAIVRPGDRVIIVTSDITRPVPSYKILPAVVRELEKGGVKKSQITVVFALGSHRPHTEEEKRALVGDTIYDSEITLMDSDPEKCAELGVCRHGTPVDIFAPVLKANRRICIGNVEFHYFAGYSGGAKALMPGVSSRRAIQANHSKMIKPGAQAGKLAGNPVREDIDQITEFIGIDFIVNVVVDKNKEIVKAFAGHHTLAHREGCRAIDEMYKIRIDRQADIVVLSPGGFPKDINLYQAQKGLDNAQHAVRPGGIIIWCASAKEGFGEAHFEEWMLNKEPAEMIEEIRKNFILGAHKAAAIAMVMQKAEIYMVSDLEDELVRKINFTPFPTVQEALDAAFAKLGSNAGVLVMPQAGSTLPYLE
ncbi:MAG TPA: nickel-dependent lactate racemase [Anaerovoracaceae bacterium]|nr:nickel-dependent lactate racemase [Anaerovoracaceae bacterium]